MQPYLHFIHYEDSYTKSQATLNQYKATSFTVILWKKRKNNLGNYFMITLNS